MKMVKWKSNALIILYDPLCCLFFLPLSVCRESLCSFTADAKRLKRPLACDVYSTMKYTLLFMNAIGLISSDIKWASQREEWLFHSLSLLVKDVKLTFTVWAETLAWCSVALDWHLILMHPVVRAAISVCFKGRGWGESANKKCPRALQQKFIILPLLLSTFFSSFVFQVFVNFARQQHDEEDSEAYSNPVDVSDELPLEYLRTSQGAEKV